MAASTFPSDGSESPRLSIKEWKRYGKHKLYVNDDGNTVATYDVQTARMEMVGAGAADIARSAVEAYLRRKQSLA